MNKLDKIFKHSKKINIYDTSKIVIMSDCHRGIGNNHDNFIKNRNIFKYALKYYYDNDFTYIELGDGDEMWEVDNYYDIIDEYYDIFKLIKKFHDSNRFIMIYGNHDISKKDNTILEKYFYTKDNEELLYNLKVYESIILNYKNNDIFLLHGHQVDLLNKNFWKLSRFLVRHIWRNLEFIGINDPTVAAKNHDINNNVEKRLNKWSLKNNKILISGHTHRPIFPKVGQSLYFNDGSCIHPNGITCIEIENGNITLSKWTFSLNNSNISIERKILEREKINNFF